MGLTADQRNHYYRLEAVRTGIHPPILAALDAVHKSPTLPTGETGLGIAPANQILPAQLSSFTTQVHYAANTIRSLTDRLIAQGWKGVDLWDVDEGRYSDRFLRAIAEGYAPPASDPKAARLEPSHLATLQQAYLDHGDSPDSAISNFAFLDKALMTFVEEAPLYYLGLSPQREGLLEAVRLWRKLDNREEAIASLQRAPRAVQASAAPLDELKIDQSLLQFIDPIASFYSGYPQQREALLRLVQRWRQLPDRATTIASLHTSATAETPIQMVDPVLILFVQQLPPQYRGTGDQRHALTECFRIWHGLPSRTHALSELGIEPQQLKGDRTPEELIQTATQLDRQLLSFIRQIPTQYQETEQQREALIQLVQRWRGSPLRDKTIQSLIEDWQQLEQEPAKVPVTKLEPVPLPPRPPQWTPENLHLPAAIVPDSLFTWASATAAGQFLPADQETVEAIVRLAQLVQLASDRLGHPLHIVGWYHPNPRINQWRDRHAVGDAMLVYANGITSNQLYWALDPWWQGGLGRYSSYPYLCYLDASQARVRWQHSE